MGDVRPIRRVKPDADVRRVHHLDWSDLLALYLVWLTAAGRSPGTIRLHRHYLRMLRERVPCPLGATTADLVALLAQPDWAPETRKSARSVLVSFYGWAAAEGLIPTSPAARLPSVSVPTGNARPAPDRALAVALLGADERTATMLRLAALAGLRCCEIARVHARDLDDVGLLQVTGKGGKVRVVPVVAPELLDAIRAADGWLFPSPHGGHLTPGTVSAILSRAMPDGWTAHTLRHRFATRAYAATRDVLAVGRALGHARPETTRRYVQLPPDALLDVVRGAA